MQNRARRCGHGFYDRLCVVASCEHYDGGPPDAASLAAALPPMQAPRGKAGYRGATNAVRLALLAVPNARNTEIAMHCGCSTSLVSAVRLQLGFPRRRTPRTAQR